LLVRAKQGGQLTRTWLLRFKWRDVEPRIVLGHLPETTLDAARGEARRLRELASQGIDPRRARPQRNPAQQHGPTVVLASNPSARHSIEFLVSEFTERHLRPRRKRPEYAQAILAKDILPAWSGRDARTIEPTEVLELLDGIVARGSKVMANRTAALLAQMFKFAIHRRIVTTTPVQLLYRPGGHEKSRERILSDEELRTFLEDPTAATRFERLAHVMTVLLLTGQRRGELALARWSDLDLEARTWRIPDENAKGGRGHVVPLTDWAAKEFRALKNLSAGSQWVLATPDGERPIDPKQLTRSLAKCRPRMKKRGIAAFTLHDLRRTCRTGLARLKVEPHIAERVLNHVQDSVAGTYDRHAYLDEKRAALEQWAAHLDRLHARP
jgi:integrase